MPSRQEEGREKWIHEDDLLNHRLTWLGVTQALLFAALGFVIQQPSMDDSRANSTKELLGNLVHGVPVIGLVTSILILVGTLAATVAMAKIKKQFELPEYGISLSTTVAGWVCAVGLPYAFTVAWALVINIFWGSIFSVIVVLGIIGTWVRVVRKNA